MVSGNDMIEYREAKCGALEEAFIKKHQEEFDKFVEEEFNNEGNEDAEYVIGVDYAKGNPDPHSQQDDEDEHDEDGVAALFLG